MKFFDVFINYLRFVMKQGSTSWLVLLYPIALIMVVGIGLTIGTSEKLSVAVLGNDSLFDSLENDSTLRIIHANDEGHLQGLVRSKQAVMGISVKSGKTQKMVKIYLDPTKQAVASSLLLLVDKAVAEEKYKSGESLSAIQQRLAPSLIDLKEKRSEISEFTNEIADIKTNITKTKQELSDARSKLAIYRAEIVLMKSNLDKIDDYRKKLGNYDSNLSALSSDIYYRQNQRDSTSNKIYNTIYKIDNYVYKVDNARSQISYAKSYYSPTGYSSYYLDQMDSELLSLRNDLTGTRSDLVTINSELSSIDFYSMQSSISLIRNDINSTSKDLGAFKNYSNLKMDSVIKEIDASDAKIASAINGLAAFESRLDGLSAKVNQTGLLLEKIIAPMEEFLGKKPEELLPPIIDSISVFEEQKKMDMFFPSIIGIDMILASLLLPMIMKVRMKDQGVELRMIMSRAGTVSVIVGEMLANYFVSMFQLMMILLFGLLFFGVHVSNPLGFMLVFITLPAVFTSIGVFLSQVVSRSSTSFLLSLLIGIPMIFISGTIIPLEFLNPVIAVIGSITPLYIAIDFTEKLFFRNVGMVDIVIDYAYLVIFTGANMVMAMFAYYLKR